MSNRLVPNSFVGKLQLGTVTSVLDAFHPSLASRFAKYLFLKPQPYSPRPDQTALLDNAVELSLSVNQFRLRGWRWGSGPAVLFVHGWSGSPLQYYRMIETVVENGYSAVAFEMPGHGKSSGTAPTLFDFSDAILAINRIYGSFATVVGHSIGALAVVMAAKEQPIASRLVLMSPLAKAQGGLTTFARLTGISISVLHRMQKGLEDHHGVLFSECEIETLASDIAVPMLVIHDREDRMSDCEPVEAWALTHPDVRFVETAGLGHQRILASTPALKEFRTFLGKPRITLKLDGLTEYAL